MESHLVDLTLEIKHETDRAILVHDGDPDKAVWLPKSAIEIERDRKNPRFAVVTMPETLAIKKGLV